MRSLHRSNSTLYLRHLVRLKVCLQSKQIALRTSRPVSSLTHRVSLDMDDYCHLRSLLCRDRFATLTLRYFLDSN